MELMPVKKVRFKMSTHTSRPRTRHRHRRYSWPPSLHLIDVSTIRVPLPDIDEDPFAHFVSPPGDDFEPSLDSIAFRAGIVATQRTLSKNDEKAYKFRTSIARKWSRFIARYYAKLPHGHLEAVESTTYPGKVKAKKMTSSTQPPTTSGAAENSSKKATAPPKTKSAEPTLGHAPALLAEVDEQTQNQRPHLRRQWHSFSELLNTLPTITEIEQEDQ